jgi:LacI family transcriptional regulator
MGPRISIRDLARHLGVSHTTVSLALRNDPRILLKTRRSVARAASALGYKRDAVISDLMAHLRTIRTDSIQATLGFLTAWHTRDGWRESANHRRFFAGVTARANDLGYMLGEFWLREPGMTPERMTSILRARGIRGLVVHSLEQPNSRLSLKWEHFTSVTKGLTVSQPRLHRVISSHYDDMQMVIERLSERGYRRVGLVLGEAHSLRVGRAWLASYLLHQNDVEPGRRVPALILKKSGAFKLFGRWLHTHEPDCLLFADQPVAQWTQELGLRSPKDIGLAHLDWSPDMKPMAGVDSDPEVLGAAAIDLLVGQLQANETGIPQREKVVEVLGRWVAGSTIR